MERCHDGGMTDDLVTPAELARELGNDQRDVRIYLRATYGKLADVDETRWRLTSEQADAARAHFRQT